MSNNICAECGADPFHSYDYTRIQKEMNEVREQIKRMCARQGVDRAEWELERISHDVNTRWLRQKVDSQRRALTRLENKLIALKQQPYVKEEKEDEGILH